MMPSITSPTIGAFLKLKLQACIDVFILIFHNFKFKSLVLTYPLDIFLDSYYDLLNFKKSWIVENGRLIIIETKVVEKS